jgi:large subunit ribosomal protein L28
MPRCELTGKGPTVKNLISHSNIKSKTWAQPNVQKRRLYSTALNRFVTLNVAVSTIRTLDQVGGLDRFILSQGEANLSDRAREVRKQIVAVVHA